MASIFDQYGIKEVADVTIYRIDESGNEVPFLFLDTLKVSTLEQTAEQSDARGGKGNPKLITWDYGKEINVTLEDALYSPQSMALMWGGKTGAFTSTSQKVTKFMKYQVHDAAAAAVETITDDAGKKWKVKGYLEETTSDGKQTVKLTTTTKLPQQKGIYDVKVESEQNATTKTLQIGADDYPGTYKLVGDTYARNRDTGEDEYFQFIIHRAKMSAEQTLTLQAEGDPTTFNLNMTVLRPTAGPMLELIQYTIPKSST